LKVRIRAFKFDIVIVIEGLKSMGLAKLQDLSCTDPSYPWTINTQRWLNFPSLPILIKSSLFGATFSSKLTVPDIITLLKTECSKDQPDPLQACKDICIYHTFYGFLSLLKNISLMYQLTINCVSEYTWIVCLSKKTGLLVLHHGRFQTWEDSMQMLCIR